MLKTNDNNIKEIKIFCEYCGRPYTKAEVEKSAKGDEFIGSYCNKCSKITNKLTDVKKVDALFKVKKGDKVVLINGKFKFEIWDYKFPHNEYVIKLYKKHKDIVKNEIEEFTNKEGKEVFSRFA